MNPLLLDTCTFVWLVALPASLSARAKRALSRPGAEFLSDASLWEISLKWRAGKLELPDPPRLWSSVANRTRSPSSPQQLPQIEGFGVLGGEGIVLLGGHPGVVEGELIVVERLHDRGLIRGPGESDRR